MNKYLKYKTKYIDLKNILIGGTKELEREFMSLLGNSMFGLYDLTKMPENLKTFFGSNQQLILDAVRRNPGNFKYASDELRRDHEFILKAISVNLVSDFVLTYVSEELRSNKEFMTKAVNINITSFYYISGNLRKDREFVIHVANKWKTQKWRGYILKYVSVELCNDKEIVKHGIEVHPQNLQFASERLCKDDEIVKLATDSDSDSIRYADNKYKNDDVLLLKVIAKKSDLFKWASQDLQNNQDFVKDALNANCEIVQYADESLIQKEHIFAAVEKSSYYIKYAPDQFFFDELFLEHAFKYRHIEDVHYRIPTHIKNNPNFILLITKLNAKIFDYIDRDDLHHNREFVLEAVKINGLVLRHIKLPEFKKDKGIVLTAIRNNKDAFKYCTIKQDYDVVLEALRGGYIFSETELLPFSKEELKTNKIAVDGSFSKIYNITELNYDINTGVFNYVANSMAGTEFRGELKGYATINDLVTSLGMFTFGTNDLVYI